MGRQAVNDSVPPGAAEGSQPLNLSEISAFIRYLSRQARKRKKTVMIKRIQIEPVQKLSVQKTPVGQRKQQKLTAEKIESEQIEHDMLFSYYDQIERHARELVERTLPVLEKAIGDHEKTGGPYLVIEGRNYLGILLIPSLDIRLPVLDDCTDDNLELCPCRYAGTAASENFIVAGHNFSRQLAPVKNLEKGEELFFLDIMGTETVYQVAERVLAGGTEIDKLYDGVWDLTVFTNHMGGKSRVVLRCTIK